MTSEVEYKCNNCGHEGMNTRAVPDVPELERVNFEVSKYGLLIEEFCPDDGEYVRYDQAAAIIAAKDAEIDRLRSATTHRMD